MIDFDDLDTAEAENGVAVEVDSESPEEGQDQPCAAEEESPAFYLPPAVARCAHERARPLVLAPRQCGRSRRRCQTGVFYGLPFPWSPGSIKALGAEWLTRAFHAAGTLPATREVSALRGVRCLGFRRRTRQVLLEVEYTGDVQEVFHKNLLAKLPRFDLPGGTDAAQDQPTKTDVPSTDHFVEINFYRLFEADSPLCMPRFYYGDVSDQTDNFIIITEWVPISTGVLDLTDTQLCFLRGYHGRYLASNPSDGSLFMSPKRKEWETWAMRPLDRGSRHFLQASGGSYLMTSSDAEQAMGVLPGRDEVAKWTISPAPGAGGHYFLKSRHQTYLASLNDSEQCLYMSPNSKDWERWRPVPIESVEARPKGCSQHLDLTEANYDTFHALVTRFAEMAGRNHAGKLGEPGLLSGGPTAADDAGGPTDANIEGPAAWADREFLDQAGLAQDFICTAGDALFPPGVVTSLSMQRFRAVLVTTKANFPEMKHFTNCNPDYIGMGLDYLDIDSAFVQRDKGDVREGLRHWDSLSVGSLGRKLWRLFSFARSDLLVHHLVELIETFCAKYHHNGGPLLQVEVLRAHFIVALCLESLQVLKVCPEFYRLVPREEWAAVTSLRDSRIAFHQTSQGSLWLCLKMFSNIFVILEHFDVKNFLHALMPHIMTAYAFGCGELQGFQTISDGVEIRAGEAGSSTLVCRVPAGCWVVTARYPVPVVRDGVAMVQMRYPITHGWIAYESLGAAPGTVAMIGSYHASELVDLSSWSREEKEGYLNMSVIAFLYGIRRQYTGSNSAGMAEISSNMIQTRWQMYFLPRFQFGARVIRGSFLAQRHSRSWWPKDYEDWAHHSFVLFGDNLIGDITADQFDPDITQVWWPADITRYSFDFQKADAANRVRRDGFGLQNWTRMCEQEDAADGKSRYPWWTVDWHTTMRLPPKAGTVLRHNEPVQLPPISRRVDVGENRPAVTFRRITAEHELEVWLIEDLFKVAEVQQLVRCCEARQGFQQSLTKNTSGQVVSDGRRTSSTCPIYFPHLCQGVLDEMRDLWGGPSADEELAAAEKAAALCADALEVDVNRIEPLQMVKYSPGQHYLPHLDAHQEPERLSSFCGEQRLQTLLVFMSDVPEGDGGGHLHFPLLGLRVLPRAGSAVLWRNVKPGSCKPDPDSLHEGVAPLASGKVAMNVWIVDRPLNATSIVSGRGRSCGRSRGSGR